MLLTSVIGNTARDRNIVRELQMWSGKLLSSDIGRCSGGRGQEDIIRDRLQLPQLAKQFEASTFDAY